MNTATDERSGGQGGLARGLLATESTPELIKDIGAQLAALVKAEAELTKTEVMSLVRKEMAMAGGLGAAAVVGLFAVGVFVAAIVLALAQKMPAWAAALCVAGFLALDTAIIATVSWRRRARDPLARTRRTLKETVTWTKRHSA